MRAVWLALLCGLCDATISVGLIRAAPPAGAATATNELDERLAREFRIANYNAFRADRDELARRQTAGAQLEAAWRTAGGESSDRELVRQWLRAATLAAQSSPARSLPPLPRFGDHAAPAAPRELPLTPMPSPINRAAPNPPTPNRPRLAPGDAPPAVTDTPARSSTGRATEPAAPPNAPRHSDVPRRATPPAGAIVDPMRTPRGIAPQRFSGPPTPASSSSRTASATAPAGVTPPGPSNAAPALEPIVGRAAAESPADNAATTRSPSGLAPTRPTPAAPALDARPAERPAPVVTNAPRRDPRPADAAAPPPQINLDELTARATAHNRALTDIDRRLAKQADWSAAELDQVVVRLAELQVLGADLNLVRELVPVADRAAIEPAGSIATVVTATAARIQATRQKLMENSAAPAPADRDAQLELLDRLSAQLVKLHQGERPRDANQHPTDRD